MSYGLSGYSLYKTYVAKDTVTHINLDSNFYRGVNWSNKLADTIDRNFIRWYDFNSHDSTLRYFKVDTIRSNPNIDSIAGNTIITGSPTITGTLTADTLKLTNGINATGGSFSSTVKADSVNSTKNITAPSVKLTNLTSGYFPYQNNSGILANGPIFTNGTNVSVCKSSVEAWSSGYRALQVGANTAIFSDVTESGTSNTWFSTNLYHDGAWKPQMSGQSQMLSFGSSGVVYQHDTGVVADVGFNPTTRFSWTLAGGLNVASKGTFTNIASGDTVSAKKGLFDSLKLGTGSYLKNYVEGSFPCTLKTSDVTVQQVGTAYYTKIGNVLTVSIPKLIGTSNSNTLKLYCRFPYKAKLTDGITDDDARSVIVNNNGPAQGMVEVPEWEGYIPFSVGVSRTGFATSGPKGIYAPFTISYITE